MTVEILELGVNDTNVSSTFNRVAGSAQTAAGSIDRLGTSVQHGSAHMEELNRNSIKLATSISHSMMSLSSIGIAISSLSKAENTSEAVARIFDVAMIGAINMTHVMEKIEHLRAAETLKDVGTGAQSAGRASSVLGLLWKAHPLTMAITALGLVAAAFTFIGKAMHGSSEEAERLKKVTEGLKEAQEEQIKTMAEIARAREFNDFDKDIEARTRLIDKAIEQSIKFRTLGKDSKISVGDAAMAIGESKADTLNRITDRGRTGSVELSRDEVIGFIEDRIGALRKEKQAVEEDAQAWRMQHELMKDPASKIDWNADRKRIPDIRAVTAPGLEEERKVLAMTNHDREVYTEQVRLTNEAKQKGITIGEREIAVIDSTATSLVNLRERYREIDEMRQQFTQLGEQIGTTIGDGFVQAALGATSWRDAAINALKDVAAEIMRMSITRPLANMLGSAFGSIGSMFAGGAAGGGGMLGTGGGTSFGQGATTGGTIASARLTPSQHAGNYDAIARTRVGRR